MKLITIILISCIVSPYFLRASEKQLSYAIDLMDHGLSDQATEAFIALYYQTDDDEEKAKCLLNMGKLSLKGGKTEVALKDWQRLVDKFPDSSEADEVKDQLKGLLESSQSTALDNIKSAIAINYLNNADFFSEHSNKWMIDTSWLPSEDFSAYWLDRVIAEFPNTKAHEMALKRKFFAYQGWEDRHSKFGLKHDKVLYESKLKEIIAEVEKQFPESSMLSAMYYQMGQHYWPRDNPARAKYWFEKSKKASGSGNYYYQLVDQRLKNWNGRGKLAP
jgi:tetratricopeptide (TPR) repeat protein